MTQTDVRRKCAEEFRGTGSHRASGIPSLASWVLLLRAGVAAPPRSWSSISPAVAVSGCHDLRGSCLTVCLWSRVPQAALEHRPHPEAPPRRWVPLPAPFRYLCGVRPCGLRVPSCQGLGGVEGPSPLRPLHPGVVFFTQWERSSVVTGIGQSLWASSHPHFKTSYLPMAFILALPW